MEQGMVFRNYHLFLIPVDKPWNEKLWLKDPFMGAIATS
jgi:hypothetical protein